MSVEKNKATIVHIWDELNRGNPAVIDECFADNFVRYAQHFGTTMDRQGYRDFGETIFTNSMPDCHVTIDDMVGEEERVAFRMTITGTFKGKQSIVKETYFARFEGGKVAEYVNLSRDISPQFGPMSLDENKAIVKRFSERMANGDRSVVDELTTGSFVMHNLATGADDD